MRKNLIILLLLLSFYNLHSQTADFSYNELVQNLFTNQSNNDAQSFGGYLTLSAKLFGNDGNTLKFQPTIFALDNLINGKATTLDINYSKKEFERNLQINIGLTPNTDNYLSKPIDIQAGFTYALLNNKEIPLEDYNTLLDRYKPFTNVQDFITDEAQNSPPEIRQFILKCFRKQHLDMLPDSIVNTIKDKFGVSVEDLINGPKHLIDSLSQTLPRRPLLTFTFNSNYGFKNSHWNELLFSGKYSSYLCSDKKSFLGLDPELDFATTVIMQPDTTKLESRIFDRKYINIQYGIDLKPYIIELKPSLSYTQILTGLYANEDQTHFTSIVEASFKVFNKVMISLDWNYDTKANNSTGNLKFQTSLL